MPRKTTDAHPPEERGEDPSEFLELLGEMERSLGPEKFQEFADELLKNERWRARMEHQARGERVMGFLNRLYQIPPGTDLPEDFAKDWEDLLVFYEHEAREDLAPKLRKPEQIDRFLRRGWCVIDREKRDLVNSLEKPDEDLRPIPAVLVFEQGQWHVPKPLKEFAVKQHPFVRFFTGQLQPATTAGLILGKIEWALKLQSASELESKLLGEAAEFLDLALSASMTDEPSEVSWLSEAREMERFWEILNSAIGFGRRLALYEVFRGGAVDEATRRAVLIPPGKKPSPQRQIINRLIEGFTAETGGQPTAMRLLKWLGGAIPHSSDAGIVFPESSLGRELEFVTWPQFQEWVKSAKKKGN